jgi:ABC-type polysaccharide/polyol phosphate transport system ATPase subunit
MLSTLDTEMSNSDTVISVQSLSKSYLVGHEGPQERYHSLRDTVTRHGKNFLRKAVDMAKGKQIIQGDTVEEFWALKDVSFEVKRGEVLGIIGRNGAGKSTLLKILSRITEPTSGKVTLRGRVASLLEVGTGFHPELSGRENIFLNGAILGMSRAEIKAKFDEIVDFAGVEKFLDTPVKRYSSGMYVRLAFAVAAHLEPEILVIDEVLAVGDADFQKKCLGKMQDVAKGGRTVIFVSHNMAAVSALCSKALLIARGKVLDYGSVEEVTRTYLRSGLEQVGLSQRYGVDTTLRVDLCEVCYDNGRPHLNLSFEIGVTHAKNVFLEFMLVDPQGIVTAFLDIGTYFPQRKIQCPMGRSQHERRFELSSLSNGTYQVKAQVVVPLQKILVEIEQVTEIQIERLPEEGSEAWLRNSWGSGYVVI